MIDAYTIGIKLTLDDAVSEKLTGLYRSLSVLDKKTLFYVRNIETLLKTQKIRLNRETVSAGAFSFALKNGKSARFLPQKTENFLPLPRATYAPGPLRFLLPKTRVSAKPVPFLPGLQNLPPAFLQPRFLKIPQKNEASLSASFIRNPGKTAKKIANWLLFLPGASLLPAKPGNFFLPPRPYSFLFPPFLKKNTAFASSRIQNRQTTPPPPDPFLLASLLNTPSFAPLPKNKKSGTFLKKTAASEATSQKQPDFSSSVSEKFSDEKLSDERRFSPKMSAVPSPASEKISGTLYLDGTDLGYWIKDLIAEELLAPPTGAVTFNSAESPSFSGRPAFRSF